MQSTTIDISKWPAEANLSAWSRITGVSHVTFRRHMKAGRLKGVRQINGIILVTREDICKVFNIRAAKAK